MRAIDPRVEKTQQYMSQFFDRRGPVREICAPRQSKYVSGFMLEITTAGGQLGFDRGLSIFCCLHGI